MSRSKPSPAAADLPARDAVQETIALVKPMLWQSALLFSPVMNILVLTSSLYMMQVFDRVLTSRSLTTLFFLTLIAMGALAILGILDLARTRIITRVGSWMERRLSGEGLQRAVEASLVGRDYRTEVLRDLSTLKNFFTGQGVLNLFDLPWIPVYLLVVFMLHPLLGLITTLGAVLLALLAWMNDRATQAPLKQAGKENTRALRQVEAAFRNAEAIDVMGMLPGIVSRWHKGNDASMSLQLKAADMSGSIMSFSKFARLALQILVLAMGADLVLNRQLTSGGMMATSIIISRALAPIESAIGSWRYTLAAEQAYTRLRDMFSRPLLRPHAMKLPAPQGLLSVEGVTFVPPGAKHPVVKGVTFEIKPGTVTALVGPSAAGKSTLARLCVGAYPPTYGNVRLDGADVFLWERTDFSQHVGYLPQDVELFGGTVRDNIARLMEADPAEVVEAAQMAGAHDMILRLPQGYETEIGEGGTLLSGGQRQRIALARAVFRAPQFVVLDEPNSSLDGEGEEALNQTILRAKERGATVLLIGHRPSILTHVDTIIVMRDGRIEAMGPKADILAKIMPQAAPQQPRVAPPRPASAPPPPAAQGATA